MAGPMHTAVTKVHRVGALHSGIQVSDLTVKVMRCFQGANIELESGDHRPKANTHEIGVMMLYINKEPRRTTCTVSKEINE